MKEQTYEDLSTRIILWADDKGILSSSTMKDQFVKTVEEVGEIAAALARNDKDLLKDAIGDSIVTLILLAHLGGLDSVDCLGAAWSEIKDRTGKMDGGIFIKDET